MNQNELKVRGARHHNLKNIDVNIPKNKIVVISGLSGSGKSTIAKLILRAIKPDSGKIFHNQKEIMDNSDELKKFRMKCQMIYQDPYDSINPRMTISDIVSEPLEIHNLGTKMIQEIEIMVAKGELQAVEEILHVLTCLKPI